MSMDRNGLPGCRISVIGGEVQFRGVPSVKDVVRSVA